mgnify:CR=1 FL=1|jgi:protein O-mannosyl-transferase
MERNHYKMGKKNNSQIIPRNQFIFGIFIVFAFILYGQTLYFEYALDDAIVITKNEFTKQGVSGIWDIFTNDTFRGVFGEDKNLVAGGRYRPLSVVTFAIEHEMFGLRPALSHFINILLYAITAILLFKVMSQLLVKFKAAKWYFSIPFLTTILFLAHPVHTEVVANIKGRDEIMTLMGALLALNYTLKYLNTKKYKYLIFSGIAFFLAFLSKENAIVFLAIIPLAVFFFTEHSNKDNLISLTPLFGATLIFLFIRYKILGGLSTPISEELLNNPFLNCTQGEKYATIFYTLLLYIKLLIFPHPLTYDYYPKQIPIIGWSDIRAWGSLLIYIVMGVIAILKFKKNSIISFSILFFIASLSIVSNLVFPIGTFMNERFIFISSIAFVLLIAWFLSEQLPKLISPIKKYNSVMLVIVGLLLSAYSLKSISRIPAWKNDTTLFTSDVETSSESAKGNATVATIYRTMADNEKLKANKKTYYEKAIKHFTKAIEIHPEYYSVYLDLGLVHYLYNKNLPTTLKYFTQAYKINKENPKIFEFISYVFNEVKEPAKKLDYFFELNKITPNLYEIHYNVGVIYGKDLNNISKSIEYLGKAVLINPNSGLALKNLGVAYGLNNNYEKSNEVLMRALTALPQDVQIYSNIGINYKNLGNAEKSKEYLYKASQLDLKFK